MLRITIEKWPDLGTEEVFEIAILDETDNAKTIGVFRLNMDTPDDQKRRIVELLQNQPVVRGGPPPVIRQYWNPISHWEDHPDHSREDWGAECAANETTLGYVDWVNTRMSDIAEMRKD
jgi:hypothetical protein